jgi:hypothetical protein
MDKPTLVKSDVEIEGRVLSALSLAKVPVSLCQLNYVSQLDEWQLVIATSWYDSRGPRQAYSRVIEALEEAGVYQDVPIRRLFLKSPEDPTVKALEQELKSVSEGSVHIVQYGKAANGNRYSVIFAPYTGSGGAVPSRRFANREDLRRFLENDLYISRSSIDEALIELSRKASTSIFNVQLTRKDARRLGVA